MSEASASGTAPGDGSSPQGPSTTGAPIQHMPRKRMAAPRFDALPEFRTEAVQPPVNASKYASDPVQRVAEVQEPRVGPLFIKYSLWAGGAAVAYTYLAGFRALWQKDRVSWHGTFRQRVLILTPLISMYIAGSGLLPMPFRTSIENALGRPAITLADIDKADRARRQAEKESKKAAEQKAAEAFADAQAKK